MGIPISVLIPTRNEEQNIRKCVDSVAWSDDIWVVDSHSADHTVEIARRLGVQVLSFCWDGKGPRKLNWSLANVPFRHEWLLVVDADEEPSAQLRDEILTRVVTKKESHAGYLVPYEYYFLGRLLKHGDRLWKLIVFKLADTRYERRELPGMENYDLEMHCHPIINGSIGTLNGPMIHRDFDNLGHYFDRHNIYSEWEALLRTRYCSRGHDGEITPRLFGSFMERRRFFKQLFLASPAKPFLYFLYSYVLRGGFLDGRQGFIYNVLKAIYWYQISIKAFEIQLQQDSASCADPPLRPDFRLMRELAHEDVFQNATSPPELKSEHSLKIGPV
jgi:glycosyltransferase involved in cell wall biosynthesis